LNEPALVRDEFSKTFIAVTAASVADDPSFSNSIAYNQKNSIYIISLEISVTFSLNLSQKNNTENK